ncbi:Uncharacterised protein [Mycobacteroides abscessus subsp. abscessus]|nr:Uncharacterised protein [Mycobacteroides abscessus subsp. abscessus]
MHVSGESHLVVLLGHYRPVDLLGDVDKSNFSMQCDDGELQFVCLPCNPRRYGLQRGSKFYDDPGGARGEQATEVSRARIGISQWPACGQYQLASL